MRHMGRWSTLSSVGDTSAVRRTAPIVRPGQGRSQVSAHSSHQSVASPLSAKRARPLKEACVRWKRQIDLASRVYCLAFLPAARRRLRGCSRATMCSRPARLARRWAPSPSVSEGPAHGEICGPGIGALPPPRETLDFGNAGTGSRLTMGVRRRPCDHRDLRRRCKPAQAANAAHPRPAEAHGRSGSLRG